MPDTTNYGNAEFYNSGKIIKGKLGMTCSTQHTCTDKIERVQNRKSTVPQTNKKKGKVRGIRWIPQILDKNRNGKLGKECLFPQIFNKNRKEKRGEKC